MHAHAMVDPVHPVVDAIEDVPAFAVGIVDQDVEHRHPTQPDIVGVHQDDLVAGVVVRAKDRQVTRLRLAAGKQVDQVGPGPGIGANRVTGLLYPQLQHPGPGGSVSNHGVGHDVPAQLGRNVICAEFAAGQGAIRKVP